MDKKAEKALLTMMNYPLFRITSEWQHVRLLDMPYVCYSLIKGFTPCIDVQTFEPGVGHRSHTMIVNQTSLGKAMKPLLHDTVYSDSLSLWDTWFMVRKVDNGRFAEIEFLVSNNPPAIPPDEEDEDEDDGSP